jgi:hypothetical protein
MRSLITLIAILACSAVGACGSTYSDQEAEVIVNQVNSLTGSDQECVAVFVEKHQKSNYEGCISQSNEDGQCEKQNYLTGIDISVFSSALEHCQINITSASTGTL